MPAEAGTAANYHTRHAAGRLRPTRIRWRWLALPLAAPAPGDAALLPGVSDLPEFLPEAAFVARDGGVDGPAYRERLAVIEARIAALPLYR